MSDFNTDRNRGLALDVARIDLQNLPGICYNILGNHALLNLASLINFFEL